MDRQYYFDEDFAGAEYRAVIDLVGRKAHFVGLVFSVGIGREERLAIEGKVSELGGIVIESSEWPGTVYYGGDRKIAVFRLNERVLDFIRTAQESVFAWQEPDSPVEDLHFFRKDWVVVLSSTAHEDFGTIALDDDDLDRMPFLKNRIDLRHPAALELLPAAERERLGGFGCWIMI